MKIIVLCGKSASGKDTIQNELMKRGYEGIVTSTSRPMRPGEVEGREYHFRTKEEFEKLLAEGKLIEHRAYKGFYNGVEDTWYFGMEKQELNPDKKYTIVLDLPGLKSLKATYGEENVIAVYLNVSENIRQDRCKNRGGFEKKEWKHRVKTDNEDFSPDKLKEIGDLFGIRVNKYNRDITPSQIADMIEENLRFMTYLNQNHPVEQENNLDDVEMD